MGSEMCIRDRYLNNRGKEMLPHDETLVNAGYITLALSNIETFQGVSFNILIYTN